MSPEDRNLNTSTHDSFIPMNSTSLPNLQHDTSTPLHAKSHFRMMSSEGSNLNTSTLLRFRAHTAQASAGAAQPQHPNTSTPQHPNTLTHSSLRYCVGFIRAARIAWVPTVNHAMTRANIPAPIKNHHSSVILKAKLANHCCVSR